jgi:hypothetical protein
LRDSLLVLVAFVFVGRPKSKHAIAQEKKAA